MSDEPAPDNLSTTVDSSEPSRAPLSPSHGRRSPLVPPRWVWIVVAVCAAIVAVVWNVPSLDRAAANVVIWISTFVAAVVFVGWYVLGSELPAEARFGSLAGLVALVGILLLLFRIDGTLGTMVPRFAWRFASKPDERLERPPRSAAAGRVDLRTTSAADFPGFLGPQRNAAVDAVRLARDWTAAPPRAVWRQPIGAGWSAMAAVGEFAVTQEQRGPLELVTCYEVLTGNLMWAHETRTRYETVLGGIGPRATPTIDDGLVYALGATGHLHCLDGASGEPIWSMHLPEALGSSSAEDLGILAYGRSNSPLVTEELVIVPAGGPRRGPQFALIAFDKRASRAQRQPIERWRGGDSQPGYCSPALATLCGVEQVLVVNEDHAAGYELASGRLLWRHPWPGNSSADANVSQPVAIADNRVFLSNGYSNGAALLELTPVSGGDWRVEVVWHRRAAMRTKFANVVIHEGYVYGLSDGILECLELESGQRRWKRGRYGHGQILRVSDVLLVLSETGDLVMVDLSPREHRELGRIAALRGKTWNNLCLVGRHLLVRNAEEAACYELSLAGEAPVTAQAER